MYAGASVAVECRDGYGISSGPRFRKEVKTDEHGEFRVRLPFSVSKHVKRIKGCTVKLVSSSEPYCAVASAATSSSLRLKSRKQGLHIFSAGFFSFKPLKQPNLCNQKPSIQNTKGLRSVKTSSFPPPLQDPNTPGGGGVPFLPSLPPLPGLPPLPQLPPMPLPPLPGVPIPGLPPKSKTSESNPTKSSNNINAQSSDQKVANPESLLFPPIIPNPLQPPPLVPNPLQPPPLIPNPLQPPSPPLIPNPFQPPSPTPLIPNPLQPPPSAPSPLFPFPPVPGLTPPSPPPSPPPGLPFPFPPIFPPPGRPPASSSKNASP